ncbi:putative reverse transcriptase domain-containing protein, partial [Tanacetum coccineum]
MIPATSSSGLVSNPIPQQPCNPPNRDDWDRFFQPMFDEYFNPPTIVVSPILVVVTPRAVDIDDSPVSTSIDKDETSTSIPSTQEQEHYLIISAMRCVESIKNTIYSHDDPLHEPLHKGLEFQRARHLLLFCRPHYDGKNKTDEDLHGHQLMLLLPCTDWTPSEFLGMWLTRDGIHVDPNNDEVASRFLGHVVNSDGIHVDPNKIEAIAKSLTILTQKNKKYIWGDEQEMTFQTLKDKLCNAPVLALLDRPEDFVIYYDASCQGLGYVLMQRGKVIAYASRQLKITKRITPLMIWNWVKLYSLSRSGDTTSYGTKSLFSDCDCEIRYHPGKANVVADALSRKERIKPRRAQSMNINIQSSIKSKILAAQNEASEVVNAPTEMLRGLDEQIEHRGDGTLYYLDRISVPLTGNIRTLIMDEAHKSRYSVHLGVDKMYYDLKDMYWWPGMKKDIALYVSKCLTCSKVKAEHQKPSGLLQQPKIPEWKWERIAIDFIMKFPRTSSRHDSIWVIMDRLTKYAHFLPIREDFKMDKLVRLYLNKIVARHGVPILIISDNDSRFTS